MSPSTLRRVFHVIAAVVLATLVFAMTWVASADAGTKLLRYPDLHGDRVVFSYAGDLWSASTSGGAATRLTAHPGLEYWPRFSPDGEWIAFTGQYDGDEQVFVIPAHGGEPKQLSWFPARGPLSPRWGFDHQVYGWTPDGGAVLFRGLRDNWDIGDSRLYTVPVAGGLPTALPMPTSGAGELSPDGTQVVYSPLFRDFRTWKRYQGGWATDLYIFDLESFEATQVTDHVRSDRDPMWIGDSIYFTSDRESTLNLYRYEISSGTTTQLTDEDTWDVRWPTSDGQNRIIHELNGELVIYDISADTSTALDITVPTDGVYHRPRTIKTADYMEGYELSPKGKRALFVARGDIYTVPVEKGPTRNLTNSSDAHDRLPAWSPDGSRIVFVSDKNGEEQLWLIDQAGKGEPTQLTSQHDQRLYQPVWSPNGEKIAYADKEGRIYILDVASKRVTEVADEAEGQSTDYSWSPNSGYLTFSLSDANTFDSIYVYELKNSKLHRVTGEMWDESNPVFGPEGDYLFYLSNRAYAPQVGSYEWNYVVDRETGIFAMALREEVPHPFPPESDEVEIEEDDAEGDEDGDKKKDSGKDDEESEGDDEESTDPIVIDFEGLAGRVARIPVEFDNYMGLSAVEGHLVYLRGGPFYYGRSSDIDPVVKIFSMEDREAEDLVEGSGYTLSHDGKKILVSKSGKYTIYDVKAGGGEGQKISTSKMIANSNPRTEWEAIFDEVWRRYRDFFYVENMHGYDWEAIADRYREWLPYIGHRVDLTYVIGEMIAELNVSHAYIQGGDYEQPDRPRVALPGARFELDEKSGRYRLAKIYGGQNEEPRYRSPLTEVGIAAAVGDYVLAINGQDLSAPENPWKLLKRAAGDPVTFLVNDKPSTDDAREVVFEPITNDGSLRYLEWVEMRRKMVEEATDGRVGYLHLPDMGSSGIQEWVKWYYGQIRKEGLVIDVRGNGGGNVSQMIIERLHRELLRIRFVRTNERVLTYPSSVFNGHLICLLNETSASDGDIFPAMFKEAQLGLLVGKRSWGGVTGITGHGPLLDGGDTFVPQFGTNSRHTGEYIIEGHGVDPDVVVENTPKSILEGRDLQLEKAIELILQQIKDDPKQFPPKPANPVRTK